MTLQLSQPTVLWRFGGQTKEEEEKKLSKLILEQYQVCVVCSCTQQGSLARLNQVDGLGLERSDWFAHGRLGFDWITLDVREVGLSIKSSAAIFGSVQTLPPLHLPLLLLLLLVLLLNQIR